MAVNIIFLTSLALLTNLTYGVEMAQSHTANDTKSLQVDG